MVKSVARREVAALAGDVVASPQPPTWTHVAWSKPAVRALERSYERDSPLPGHDGLRSRGVKSNGTAAMAKPAMARIRVVSGPKLRCSFSTRPHRCPGVSDDCAC